jgi:hypothetical protein
MRANATIEEDEQTGRATIIVDAIPARFPRGRFQDNESRRREVASIVPLLVGGACEAKSAIGKDGPPLRAKREWIDSAFLRDEHQATPCRSTRSSAGGRR